MSAQGRLSFFAELQRRNVYKVGAMYAVAGWLLVQVVTQVLPIFDVSALAQRIIVLAIIAGFPAALVLSWIYELTPAGIVKTDDVAPNASIARHTGQQLNRAIISVLLLAVLVLLARLFWPHAAATVTAANPPATVAASDQSIAVLPLTDESGDKNQQYFSDGLSEDLITALSQFAGLKVIGRNSSFRFRDSKDDARSIGAALGVAHLLEGSVRRAGDTVRISAELVNVVDGSALWSQHYDRPYTDLFKLQDEITTAVAAALKTKLMFGDAGAVEQNDRPPSGNLDAYKAYLQGRFYGARGTEQDDLKAVDFYKSALRLDPRYAEAYVGLSRNLSSVAGNYLGGAQAQRAYAQSREALNTAFALDDNLASAHFQQGWLLSVVDFDWSGAEAEYRRALQLAPNDSQMMFGLGWLLANLGHAEPGVKLFEQALAIDPLSEGAYATYSRFLPALGRLDEAAQAARKAIELQPTDEFSVEQLVLIEILRGNAQAALHAARGIPAGDWRDLALAFALQVGGDRAAADAALNKLIEAQAGYAAFQIAEIYALRKQPDEAFKWLDRARDNRDPGVQLLLTDPLLKTYRDDPRFAAFCKTVNLPAPARS